MLNLFVKSVIFSVIVPGIVAVLIPILIAGEKVTENIFFILPGLLLLACGSIVYSWCVWDFVSFGKGTPAPIAAPKHLVVRGLYHYSRNPMYVGVLLVISGWALIYSRPAIFIYGLFVIICFQMIIVLYEEPRLHHIFGRDFKKYRAKVNRWLPDFL